MEPLSVIAALCGVVTALHAMYQWWHHFLARRLAQKVKDGLNETESTLQECFLRIWNRYNRLASVMGRSFQLSFNETLTYDLKVLAPKLKRLQLELKELEKIERTYPHNYESGHDELSQRAITLTRYTKKIQDETETALNKLYSDTIAEADVSRMENQQLNDIEPPRQFCEAARQFQTGDKNDDYLSQLASRSPSRSGWGYICRCCGLEVGYYPAVRISSTGKALDSSILLTASHLTTFKSTRDRRAFYRCLPCYKRRKLMDFPSAVAFEKHMEGHPDFVLMRKQDEAQKLSYIIGKQDEFMQGIEVAKDEPGGTLDKKVDIKGTSGVARLACRTPSEHEILGDVRGGDREKGIEINGPTQQQESKEQPSGSFSTRPDHTILDMENHGDVSNGPQTGLFMTTSTQPTVRPLTEFSQDMPGSFPSGVSGFGTPASTAVSEVDANDVSGSQRENPATLGHAEAHEAGMELNKASKNQTTGDFKTFSSLDLEADTASLPIGLVERPSEPRSGVMSPAPADPLVRITPPSLPHRPAENNTIHGLSAGNYSATAGDSSKQNKPESFQRTVTHGEHSDTPPRGQTFTSSMVKIVSTPPKRTAPAVPPAAQEEIFRSAVPLTQAVKPALIQMGSASTSTSRGQSTSSPEQSKTSPTSSTSTKVYDASSGTWEQVAHQEFVYYDSSRKALKEQKAWPLDEWIFSKRSWKGQEGKHWVMVNSGSGKVFYATEDPRQKRRNE